MIYDYRQSANSLQGDRGLGQISIRGVAVRADPKKKKTKTKEKKKKMDTKHATLKVDVQNHTVVLTQFVKVFVWIWIHASSAFPVAFIEVPEALEAAASATPLPNMLLSVRERRGIYSQTRLCYQVIHGWFSLDLI